MKELRRWLDDAGELSSLERRVLEAAQRVSAPESSKRQVWAALAAALPPPTPTAELGPSLDPTGGAGATTGAGGAAALGGVSTGTNLLAVSVLKALGVGFMLGSAAVGGSVWLDSAPPSRAAVPAAVPSSARSPARAVEMRPGGSPPRVLAPTPVASTEARSVPAARVEAPAALPSSGASDALRVEPGTARAAFPDVPAPSVAAPPAVNVVAPALDVDRARLESQRVAEARGALRAGNPRAALALLERIGREFPSGVLVQEREALTVDALLSCGERAAARARAQDFVTRYPGSPHTSAVRRALE